MSTADDLPEEPAQEASADSPPESPPRAGRESGWLLLLGFVFFLAFVALAWLPQLQRPPGPGYQESVSARLMTNMTAAVLSWQLRGDIPQEAQPLLAPQLAMAARGAAVSWERLSRESDDPRYAGFTALNAAALLGVAEDLPAAREALEHAARRDPAHAEDYRALLPLYASPPRPVAFPAGVEEALAQISSGPIIRARNAQLAGDTAAAIATLEPAARAGRRAFLANGISGLLILGLFVSALLILLLKRRPIARAVDEVPRVPAERLPWGIGAALILVTTVYLITTLFPVILAPRGAEASESAALVIQAVSTPLSALLVIGLFLVALGRRFTDWSALGWWPARRGALYGLGALVLVYPAVILAALLSSALFRDQVEAHPLIPVIQATQNPWLLLFWVLIAVVMAPLVEETLFRGVLFRALHERLPFWGAAALSGFLFAILHAQLIGILPITLLGILFAFLYVRTGSLLAPAIAHAGFNGVAMLNALLLAWALRTPGA